MYALRYDGFVQDHILYKTLEEAKEVHHRDIMNTMLYEYECAVVEVVDGKVIRTLSFEELK